ncbi:Myo-inositol oxygenase [Operophtera brumata]|uniref:Inositol oxygenase n=1 Tax=Operophtera brumata TaxID=104452 RepID=A0A0L7KZ75_OPEBR|nr:Myo-inositol oxygenase [Operophtera brumata]
MGAGVQETVGMIDPSLLLRPEAKYDDKPIEAFRNYDIDVNDPVKERVRKTYYDMHTNQTVDFVQAKLDKWTQFNHMKLTIKEALIKLNDLVDESDPDTELPNIVHAFQTAERIRQDHPNDDWFHLIGLIHDLGKVMLMLEKCYLLEFTYHSFYPWHAGGDYKHLLREGDVEIMKHVLEKWVLGDTYVYIRLPMHVYSNLSFGCSKYDLYTKSGGIPDIEALWPYYESLIEKYIPGKWTKFNHMKLTIKEALIKLNDLLDESDPDTDMPNIVHAFQTAERIRKEHPDKEWFQLIGLIHDLGKPQWCVVGDTFALGCKWGKSIVYGDDSFKDNPDSYNPKYK